MPEGIGAGSAAIRRVERAPEASPVRAPGTRRISKAETRGEDQRQYQNRKHGIDPVVAPQWISPPSCDDIKISNGDNFAIR
jgi:hypothetical protein